MPHRLRFTRNKKRIISVKTPVPSVFAVAERNFLFLESRLETLD